MLLDAIFPRESSSFFFLVKGGVVEGKTKNLFFFYLVLTITPVFRLAYDECLHVKYLVRK